MLFIFSVLSTIFTTESAFTGERYKGKSQDSS